MAHRIKNTSDHAQGIPTLNRRTVYIPAGEERTLELADVARTKRFAFLEVTEIDARVPEPSPEVAAQAIAKFDHDGDGLPGGSKPKAKAAPVKRRRRKRRARPKAKP